MLRHLIAVISCVSSLGFIGARTITEPYRSYYSNDIEEVKSIDVNFMANGTLQGLTLVDELTMCSVLQFGFNPNTNDSTISYYVSDNFSSADFADAYNLESNSFTYYTYAFYESLVNENTSYPSRFLDDYIYFDLYIIPNGNQYGFTRLYLSFAYGKTYSNYLVPSSYLSSAISFVNPIYQINSYTARSDSWGITPYLALDNNGQDLGNGNIIPSVSNYAVYTDNGSLDSIVKCHFDFSFYYLVDTSNPLYAIAYDRGYGRGLYDGRSQVEPSWYEQGYNDGYSAGYDVGYNASQPLSMNFLSLIGAIADTPVLLIRNLYSFDLFGTSALTIFMTLLTAVIVIHFIRKFI